MTLLRQTELGMLPANWEVVEFNNAVKIKSGQVDPKKKPYRIMFHIGPENIQSNTGQLLNVLTNEEKGIRSGNYHFTNDDILYAKINPYLNKVAIPGFEGTCSADIYPLRPQKGFDKFFLFQLLLSDVFTTQSISFQNRAGIPKINRNQLGMILLPKPPLEEQHHIAYVLTTIQSAINQQSRLIELTRELKSALMRKLFTEGLRGEKQKETEIGLVPQSWDIQKVEGNAEVKGGKRLPKGEKLVDEKTDYPYLRVTDFEDYSINVVGLKFLLPETQAQIKHYTISDKDVFISIAGTIGITGMVPPNLNSANLTENAAKIVIKNENLNPSFLMYFLSTDSAQREIYSRTVKNAQPKLALVRIKSLKIPVPDVDEQNEIVQTLDTIRQKITSLQLKQNLLEELFRTLLHQLMTAQIRVNEIDLPGFPKEEKNEIQ